MTADRLAALLHDLAIDVRGSCDHSMYEIHADGRPGYEKTCVLDATRLAAAGVTLAPPPAGLDVERLARALARRTDRTDAWVLLPKEMQDLWRKDAAAIAREYGAAQPAPDALRDYGANPEYSRGWQDGYRRAEAVAAENRDLRDQIDALRAAAQEHGLCSCADFGGPRPLGNGQEYHYVGCDYDPALRAALEGRTA